MAESKFKTLLVHVGPNTGSYLFRSHPLGLMYLSSYVEREIPGVETEILDLKVSEHNVDDLGRIADERGAKVVGLSALTVHAGYMDRAARAVRSAMSDTLIITGGPHATCFPREVLKNNDIDAVVQGEGEQAFAEILRSRMENRGLEGIPSVVTRKTDELPCRDMIEDLSALPFPAWHKIDLDAYSRYSSFCILGHRRYMCIFTSRACPYRCIYCHNIFGHRFRPRSAESVLDEIRTLYDRYNIRDFDVLDDVFNLNRERVVSICESLIKDGPKIQFSFPNGLRSDLLDDELLELLREAGVTYISFAIETASPRLQTYIHKNLDIMKAERAIRKAAKLGILCNGFFMVGFPTETEHELRSTISFAVRSPLDTAHFLKVTPFEGTELYNCLDPAVIETLKEHPERLRYEDRTFNLSEVPNGIFKRIVRGAFMRFYLNPFRAFGLLRHHPAPLRLISFIKVALLRIFILG